MAAEGKLQAEINRMFFLVGILQEQSLSMSKQLMTLTSGTNNSAECMKDLTGKESAAKTEAISQEAEEREQGEENEQLENTTKKPIMVDSKGKDTWITWITTLQKMLKMKEGAPEVSGLQELKGHKKYDWGLPCEYERLVEFWQQLLPSILEGRKIGVMENGLLRDFMIDIRDFQQNRRRGTERDLKASDVRNPG